MAVGRELLAAVAVSAAALAAVAPSSVSAASANWPGQVTAAGIVRTALEAVHTSGAVHVVDVTRSSAGDQVEVADLSTDASRATLTQGRHLVLELLQIGPVVYIRTGTQLLQSDLGVTAQAASAASGKWVGIESGQPPYARLANALSLSQELASFIPGGHLVTGRSRLLHGRAVVPVTGSAPSSAGRGVRGSATLFVSVDGTHLPVGASLVLERGKTRVTEEAAFTNWGVQPSAVSPPAISYSSLAGT